MELYVSELWVLSSLFAILGQLIWHHFQARSDSGPRDNTSSSQHSMARKKGGLEFERACVVLMLPHHFEQPCLALPMGAEDKNSPYCTEKCFADTRRIFTRILYFKNIDMKTFWKLKIKLHFKGNFKSWSLNCVSMVFICIRSVKNDLELSIIFQCILY